MELEGPACPGSWWCAGHAAKCRLVIAGGPQVADNLRVWCVIRYTVRYTEANTRHLFALLGSLPLLMVATA